MTSFQRWVLLVVGSGPVMPRRSALRNDAIFILSYSSSSINDIITRPSIARRMQRSPATMPITWWTINPTVLKLTSDYAYKGGLINLAESRDRTSGSRRDPSAAAISNGSSVIFQQRGASNDLARSRTYSATHPAKATAPPMVRLEVTERGRAFVVVDKAQLYACQNWRQARQAYHHGTQIISQAALLNQRFWMPRGVHQLRHARDRKASKRRLSWRD